MRTLWFLTRRTLQAYSVDNCSHLAAAISYYVLFSLIPLLIFVVSIFGFIVRNRDIQQEVIDRVVEATPLDQDEGQNLVTDTVRGVSRVSGVLSVVSALGMVWSASAMIGAVRGALNIVWGNTVRRPPVQEKLIDIAMVLGIGLLLGASIAGTTALHIVRELSNDALGPLSSGTGFFWTVLPLALPGLLTFLLFLLMYRYVSNTPTSLRDVWPGALLSALLFETLKNGFAIYVAQFSHYDIVYGSLGGIMLFLLWTYLAASILLLGAELASEYGRLRSGEYAEALAQPGESAAEQLRRFVRGLFVQDREETRRPTPPSSPKAGD